MIKSLLDLDFYKLTMMQLAWRNFSDLTVKFQFHNRTTIDLSEYVSVFELRKVFKRIQKLRFSESELLYLESLDTFEKGFLEYLSTYELPMIEVSNDFDIYTISTWKEAILWETIVLSVVNQMYYEGKYSLVDREKAELEGINTLHNKLSRLNGVNFPKLITDFGTRRRFSADWQDKVVSIVSNHPSFSGTSNVYLAMKYNWTPIGTNAHELYMISAGFYGETDDGLKRSHSFIMNQWYHMYGEKLSIGLTDTFGSNFFFEDFRDKAHKWKGLRHDSGDPFEFGERVIEFYESLGIDPMTKLCVFSDGLDLEKIIALEERFRGRIQVSFGWGTKLTNDLGFETLSIVMKAVEVISDGEEPINRMLVKLSDNLNKHMGPSEEVEKYKRVFSYTNNKSEKLVV